jgi:hypothetical protein
MTTPNLTDTAQSTVDLLRQYDCPHLQQAATDLQAAIVAELRQAGTVIAPGPWKARGRPKMDYQPIVDAIEANWSLPPSQMLTQEQLAAELGVSVKTLRTAWRERR